MQKLERNQTLFKSLSFLTMWTTQVAVWLWVWMAHYAEDIMRPFGYKGNWLVAGVYGALYLLFSRIYGGYQVGYYRKWDLTVAGLLTLFFANGITYLQTCLIGRAIMDFAPFAVMTAVQSFVIVFWAYLAGLLYIRLFPPFEMLLVAGESRASETLTQKMLPRSDRYHIKETISAEMGFQAITDRIVAYQTVVLCDLPARLRNQLLKFCFSRSIRTYTTPKLSDILIRGGMDLTLFDTPLLLNRNQGLNYNQRILKRAMDLSLSIPGVVLLSPLMLCIAVAIKLYDGGAVFFLQDRCTIDNRVFKIRKFRSMVVDAEKDGRPCPATDNDERITPVGRLLRSFRLDELPQLFNVIKGEMSLVGPRPERIEHIEKYTADMPEFSFRSRVKGGITGYAQVMGRYNTSPYDKLKMDLMYITNYSFLGDIKLLLMTLKIVLMKDSTQGFRHSE